MSVSEDRELFGWATAARRYGGEFVKTIARAAFIADDDNYAMLRPVMLAFKAKYPRFDELAALDNMREMAEANAHLGGQAK